MQIEALLFRERRRRAGKWPLNELRIALWLQPDSRLEERRLDYYISADSRVNRNPCRIPLSCVVLCPCRIHRRRGCLYGIAIIDGSALARVIVVQLRYIV